MQFVHAMKLGCDSKIDKLAESWMNGEVKPGALQRMIAHTENEHRKKLDRINEHKRIEAIRAGQELIVEDVECVVEEEDEMLALFAAIEDIQAANKERTSKTLH